MSAGRITALADTIQRRADPAGFVGRAWLIDAIAEFRDSDTRRRLVIVGEPGSGKSTLVEHLATHWNCPRHFCRVDSMTGVSGLSAKAFLVSIGSQLFQKYGSNIFPRVAMGKVSVKAGFTGGGSGIVGRVIEQLYTIPFLAAAPHDVEVASAILVGDSTIIGERIAQVHDVAATLDEKTLLHVMILDPLARLAELVPNERVLLLVDAIDELGERPEPMGSSPRVSQRELSILAVLPSTSDAAFPDNLRLVMTSRPGPHLTVFRVSEFIRLAAAENLTLNRADLVTYVKTRLGKSPLAGAVAALSDADAKAFEDRLVKAARGDDRPDAAGNFLHLRYLLDALAGAAADGRPIGGIPILKDLDEVYRFFAVGRIKGDNLIDQWVEHYLPVLGVLAVLREAVESRLIAAYAGVGVSYVAYILAELAQFLDTIPGASVAPRYRLFHSSFAEYLLDPVRNYDYPIEANEANERVVQHYSKDGNRSMVDWSGVTEAYPFRHLARHILLSNNPDLYGLISRNWMDASFSRLSSYRYFTDDVRLAVSSAKRQDNLFEVVRLSTILASLASISGLVPPAALAVMAATGNTGRAEGYAALIPEVSARDEAWSRMAVARPDLANDYLSRIAQPSARCRCLIELAGQYTGAQSADALSLLDQAADVAAHSANGWEQITNVARVAVASAALGLFDRGAQLAEQAEAILGDPPDGQLFLAGLRLLAEAWARMDHPERVQRLVARCSFAQSLQGKDAIKDAIATALPHLTGLEGAVALAKESYDPIPMLADLAHRFARNGDRSLAARIAVEIEAILGSRGDWGPREGALLSLLAWAWVSAGDCGRADAAVARANGAARAAATRSTSDGKLPWLKGSAWILAGTSRGLALAGHLGIALELAEDIDETERNCWPLKASALEAIARAEAVRGHIEEAGRYLQRAVDFMAKSRSGGISPMLSALPDLPSPTQLMSLGPGVTAFLIDIGCVDEAQALLAKCPPEDRDKCLAQVAIAFIRSGRTQEGLKAVNDIGVIQDRARAFADAAHAILLTGEQSVAAQVAASAVSASVVLPDPWQSSLAAASLAGELADLGDIDRAAEVTLTLRAADPWGVAVRRIMSALLQANRVEQLVSVAQTVTSIVCASLERYDNRVWIACAAISVLNSAKRLGDALALAQQVVSCVWRLNPVFGSRVVDEIAPSFIELGAPSQALRLVRTFHLQRGSRWEIYRDVAVALLSPGRMRKRWAKGFVSRIVEETGKQLVYDDAQYHLAATIPVWAQLGQPEQVVGLAGRSKTWAAMPALAKAAEVFAHQKAYYNARQTILFCRQVIDTAFARVIDKKEYLSQPTEVAIFRLGSLAQRRELVGRIARAPIHGWPETRIAFMLLVKSRALDIFDRDVWRLQSNTVGLAQLAFKLADSGHNPEAVSATARLVKQARAEHSASHFSSALALACRLHGNRKHVNLFLAAIRAARNEGRRRTLEVVQVGISLLATDADALWSVHGAMQEIDSWWSAEGPST